MFKNHLFGFSIRGYLSRIFFFSVVLIINGCVFIPTPPTSLHSKHGVIPHKVRSSIKLGETTREDVVLLLGAPDWEYEGERFFVYQWIATEGMIAFAAPGGGARVVKKHLFCIEFDGNNKIKRFKHIRSFFDLLDNSGRLLGISAYVTLETELDKWMSDSSLKPSLSIEIASTEVFTVDENEFVKYRIKALNYSDFPTEMFQIDPVYPTCGQNVDNTSRTWVYILDGDGNYLRSFCDLDSLDNLNGDIWFSIPKCGDHPSQVYIKLFDHKSSRTYKSNTIDVFEPSFYNSEINLDNCN